MDSVSIASVVLGVILIVTRAPFVIAPAAGIRFFRRMIQSDTGGRVLGLFVGLLGAGGLWASWSPESGLAVTIAFIACVATLACVWLLIAPAGYRALFDSFVESAGDGETTRVLTGIGVLVGMLFVHLGTAG